MKNKRHVFVLIIMTSIVYAAGETDGAADSCRQMVEVVPLKAGSYVAKNGVFPNFFLDEDTQPFVYIQPKAGGLQIQTFTFDPRQQKPKQSFWSRWCSFAITSTVVFGWGAITLFSAATTQVVYSVYNATMGG